MAPPVFLHGLFHAIASLGYIPIALTSAFISCSTPPVAIPPVGTILLALVPPLTLFPALCFFYRRLERFDLISLTVQRARIYVMLAGVGLCVLVGAHLIQMFAFGHLQNSIPGLINWPHPPVAARLTTRALDTNHDKRWIYTNPTTQDSVHAQQHKSDHANIDAIDLNKQWSVDMDMEQGLHHGDVNKEQPTRRLSKGTATRPVREKRVEWEKRRQRVHNRGEEASGTDSSTSISSEFSSDLAPSPGLSHFATETGMKTRAETKRPRSAHRNQRRVFLPELDAATRIRRLQWLAYFVAQVSLVMLLALLFLGVLILTECVLDQEDADSTQTRTIFWVRVVGVAFSAITSAVHGSALSGYVLLDGRSDWIAKAAVTSIGLYWVSMGIIIRRIVDPLP